MCEGTNGKKFLADLRIENIKANNFPCTCYYQDGRKCRRCSIDNFIHYIENHIVNKTLKEVNFNLETSRLTQVDVNIVRPLCIEFQLSLCGFV